MGALVRATEDAAEVLANAGELLTSDPVRHNVILTLLEARIADPDPGRYWIVDIDGRAAGVVFQSPLDWPATITPMVNDAVAAAVDAIVEQGVTLPGVTGEANTAAWFAGRWTERARTSARPTLGQRIYEVDRVLPPRPTPGHLRRADAADRGVCIEWIDAFHVEIDERSRHLAAIVERRLTAGQLWLWDDQGPVSLAGISGASAGVVRIGPVYTPPQRRACGYASALVAGISQHILDRTQRCILYTDLDNPTSNAIYRAIGYRSVAEVLKYEFDPPR